MTETQSSTVASCSILGASENDEIFYWDTIRFSVQGCIFKVPKYHFIQGSEYFTAKYLSAQGDEEAVGLPIPIVLEDVTAPQFRTFLRALFPIHTTSTTTKFAKAEWHIILTLATLWRFKYLRKLAIDHLKSSHTDPFELIKEGRAAFVSSWLLAGYEMLATRPEAISEEESGTIGHLTSVRLYIIRHDLQVEASAAQGGGGRTQCRSVRDRLEEKFGDELGVLRIQESERRTKEEVQRDEQRRAEEAERVMREIKEQERIKKEQKLEEELKQSEFEVMWWKEPLIMKRANNTVRAVQEEKAEEANNSGYRQPPAATGFIGYERVLAHNKII